MCSTPKKQKQAVCGIIFSQDKKSVLLIKRRDVPVWVLPGGGVDPGESPDQAIVREMQEETGFEVIIKRCIARYLPVNRLTQLTHFYECAPVRGNLQNGSETLEVKFFSLDKLPTKLIPPPYVLWIKDACQNTQEVMEKKIEGVSYFVMLKLFLMHPTLVLRFILAKMGVHLNSKDNTSSKD